MWSKIQSSPIKGISRAKIEKDKNDITTTKDSAPMGMVQRGIGALMVFFAIVLLCWIGYNLMIERLPVTQGKPILPPIFFGLTLLRVGFAWSCGRRFREIRW